jgi:hypothetical protein
MKLWLSSLPATTRWTLVNIRLQVNGVPLLSAHQHQATLEQLSLTLAHALICSRQGNQSDLLGSMAQQIRSAELRWPHHMSQVQPQRFGEAILIRRPQ